MKAIRTLFVLAVVTAPAVAQEKVKFEPKFVAGPTGVFYQSVTTDVKQTITVAGGSELKLAHSQTFFFKWEPLKQEGDKWTLKMKIEGMKLNVDISTNQVKYDSTNDKPDGGNNPTLTEFFKNLKDTEFTVTIGKGGVVEKVEGKDDFLKKLGGANPQMEGILKKILTDEALKEMADPLAGLAGGDKAVNESWNKPSKIALGPIGGYDRTLTFTYKQKEAAAPGNENVHRVETAIALTYTPPTENSDGLLFRIKAGKLEPLNPKPGFFRFDANKGYVKEAELSLTLKGNLTVTVGSTETQVDLYQEQTTKIKTQDTSFNVQAGPTAGPGVTPKQ